MSIWDGDGKPQDKLTFEAIQRAIAKAKERATKPDRFGDIYFCLECRSFNCEHATRPGEADAN
jgi:hypothetical protein